MNEEKNKGGMMSVIAALGANVLVAISKFIGFCNIWFGCYAERVDT